MVDNSSDDKQIEDAQSRTVAVSSKEFSAKYKSKREIFNFLATDVGIYLPPYDNVTIYFLKELMQGSKLMLRNTEIRTCHIP